MDIQCFSTKITKSDEFDLNIPLPNFPSKLASPTTAEPPLLKDFAKRRANPPSSHGANSTNLNGLATVNTVTNDDKIQQLYDKLRRHSIRGETEKVYSQVSHLIRYAREKPNKRLYQALIRVNVSHDTGSASKVVSLLKEMDAAGVPLDVEICQDVLAV